MSRKELNGYHVSKLLPEEIGVYSEISTTDAWVGWAYTHRLVAERRLGRKLMDGEIVHHLDCDRSNNDPSNLVVLVDRASHALIHAWIDSGAPVHPEYVAKHVAHYGKPKPTCKICGNPVTDHVNSFCSTECAAIDQRKVKERPTWDILRLELENNSYLAVGKRYGVSDNAVRKWVRAFGYDPKTLQPL